MMALPPETLVLIERGGPALWAIAGLSVLTLALILWKLWRLVQAGAWRRGPAARATEAWLAGRPDQARAALARRPGLRGRLLRSAIETATAPHLPEPAAREETARIARRLLNEARAGLRGLELIAVIAPLLGLLGTVLGMIEAFQALQQAGARADPAALAGGIWQALLTTAAGMGVAILASVALAWFDAVVDALQADMEDAATRIFTHPQGGPPCA